MNGLRRHRPGEMFRGAGKGWLAGLALLAGAALVAGCQSPSSSSDSAPAPQCPFIISGAGSASNLKVTSSTPASCTTGEALSLQLVTVGFNLPVATTFDSINFVWPFLANVQPYLVFQDMTAQLPIHYFLDNDSGTNSLLFYLSDAPQAGHTYQLTLLSNLPSEGGPVLAKDTTVAYGMGGTTFGLGVFADRVIPGGYNPMVPAGSTLGVGRYIGASMLGQPESALKATSLGAPNLNIANTEGGSIVVGLGDGTTPQCITNGTGPDFKVIENVFAFTDAYGAENYTEAAYVEVSTDNVTFYRFPSQFPTAACPAVPLIQQVGNPACYSGLTGITVGGDSFDLSDIITANSLPQNYQACYVRIVDAGTKIPDYDAAGSFGVFDNSGADIEAVQVLNAVPTPGLSP